METIAFEYEEDGRKSVVAVNTAYVRSAKYIAAVTVAGNSTLLLQIADSQTDFRLKGAEADRVWKLINRTRSRQVKSL